MTASAGAPSFAKKPAFVFQLRSKGWEIIAVDPLPF
jgi:hypothetical protein